MELSLFLAKLFGLYMLAVSVLWALRGDAISKSVEELFASRGMLFISGLLALVAGIAIVISHSVWELNWRGVITLFGYLSVVKGAVRIAFPEIPQRATKPLLSGKRRWIIISLAFALGLYLTWAGFTQG